MGLRVNLGEGWAELSNEFEIVQDRISRAAGLDENARIAFVDASGALSKSISDSLRPFGENLAAIQNEFSQAVSPIASLSLELQAAVNQLILPTSPEMLEAIRLAFPPRPHFPSPSLIRTARVSRALVTPSAGEIEALQTGRPLSLKRGRSSNSWSYAFVAPQIESYLAIGLAHYTIAEIVVNSLGWAGTINEACARRVVYAASEAAAIDGLARWIKKEYRSKH